ncbi:hypothetical protein [Chitinimonas sp. BJB300]|uniref:hypothetical protein n=1 Tax=Chitinimonas sp. BJB300 TaxID=1559339 RepID=UPI000C11D511|nr:hypothetical protein [Chitinimonas sp. BJB300]PHV12035.1 hypothetical protein CSQ89_07795 [Chitinimonas sp. BJB300]
MVDNPKVLIGKIAYFRTDLLDRENQRAQQGLRDAYERSMVPMCLCMHGGVPLLAMPGTTSRGGTG